MKNRKLLCKPVITRDNHMTYTLLERLEEEFQILYSIELTD